MPSSSASLLGARLSDRYVLLYDTEAGPASLLHRYAGGRAGELVRVSNRVGAENPFEQHAAGRVEGD